VPAGQHDDLPLVELAPGYASRCADWGGMTVSFEKMQAGQDASSMLVGLPDDRCQAHHWGFMFSGRMVVDYGDRKEAIAGGQAYYVAPGHTVSFDADSQAVEFTPTGELQQTLDVARRNLRGRSVDARAD
jgi:hypothetical protein